MSWGIVAISIALLGGVDDSDNATTYDHVRSEVREILADERYAFCHDRSFRLSRDEHAWCPLLSDGTPACPALEDACKAPPRESSADGSIFGRSQPSPGAGGSDTDAADGPAQRGSGDDAPPPRESSVTLPVLGFMRVVFFALLAAFVGFVVWMIVRRVMEHRDASPQDHPSNAVPESAAATRRRAIVETDVSRLLARARASAARGDFADAIASAYAALLRQLDGEGMIEIHASRTNGDYVRALRSRPEVLGAVRSIVVDVELVQFGAAAPSSERFQSIWQRVLPLVGKAAAIATLCLGLGASTACSAAASESGRHVKGADPSGASALQALLETRAIEVKSISNTSQIEGESTLVLKNPDLDDDTWQQLLQWAIEHRSTIIIAGASDSMLRAIQMAHEDAYSNEPMLVRDADMFGHDTLSIPGGSQIRVDDMATAIVLLGRAGQAYAAARWLSPKTLPTDRYLSATVVVLADDRLLTNLALTTGDNASFLVELFSYVPGPVVFVDTMGMRGAASPIQSIHRANLTPVVAQLLAMIVLYLLYRGVAFGRLREPAPSSSRAFSDHVRALGVAYARARASRHVAGMYAAWALDRMRERARLGTRHGLVPLAEALAARTGRKESEVMKVLLEVHSIREDAGPPSSFRPSQLGSFLGRSARAGHDSHADLVLMHRLDSFLAALGDARPKAAPRSSS